ncbi:hypothetical protein HMPREF0061_1812, partial [Aerococcus viridans ATCC 11563 = CCUG 4311]
SQIFQPLLKWQLPLKWYVASLFLVLLLAFPSIRQDGGLAQALSSRPIGGAGCFPLPPTSLRLSRWRK